MWSHWVALLQIVVSVAVVVIPAVLSLAMWQARHITRLEQKVEALCESHDRLRDSVVYRDVFEARLTTIEAGLNRMQSQVDHLARG